MRIDFEEGELEDLREAAQTFINGLITELARAEQREYRAMLKEKCARFERLYGRLERAGTASERAIGRAGRTS